MDILIPDSWLRDFISTSATSKDIARCLSLCGPSVERINKVNGRTVYSVEVTANRPDSASVYGIARESGAILPRFGYKTKFVEASSVDQKFLKSKVKYLKAIVDKNLCPRFTAILIKNTKIGESPTWLKNRLNLVGVRPINNAVDVSNYIMHEFGQPVHTFDYDKIAGRTMKIRESKKGERIKTLDSKTHILPGGDIVVEDGKHNLIDLAGIMGGENSEVDKSTKNVLLFVQNYNPERIRRTSMTLAHRTLAAELFEKGIDPELVSVGINRGIDLFKKLKIGFPTKEILDIYPSPYKTKSIDVSLAFINNLMGTKLLPNNIIAILNNLGFGVDVANDILKVQIPSWREKDIAIQEDVVEEVARIYGYHNLPSILMGGVIPANLEESPFEFETKIKNILSGWGGNEIYTSSLISKDYSRVCLKLKNPLGKEGEYLRTSLAPSLIAAASSNSHITGPFHLFEVANVYIPIQAKLPKEEMTLGGIFSQYTWRKAKGIVEGLLSKLKIHADFLAEDEQFFVPSQRVRICVNKKTIGQFGQLEAGFLYYNFDLYLLRKLSNKYSYVEIPKYPAQIEDITLKLPDKIKVGEVMRSIEQIKNVSKVVLIDTYASAFTFRVWYQDLTKTLENKEVEIIRKKILENVNKQFGGYLKD